MRRVGIWASGLLASAIPFAFVGAVIALVACVFDAAGQHTPPARSELSFQPEAAQPEQALAVASVEAQRQLGKHPRHQHAGPPRQAASHFRVSQSSLASRARVPFLPFW